jgi:hypothetical protein
MEFHQGAEDGNETLGFHGGYFLSSAPGYPTRHQWNHHDYGYHTMVIFL